MELLGGYIILLVCAVIVGTGIIKRLPVFDCFLAGAKSGLECAVGILPSLTALIMGVTMLRASGITDFLAHILSSVLGLLGFPPEVLPLALLRPISGSGSLAALEDILNTYGADSFAGRVASVISGSTETTFYTVAVYFGAVGIKKTGITIPAALCADACGFILSSLAVKLFIRA